MKKMLAVLLVLAMVTAAAAFAAAEGDTPELITVTVFRGSEGEQPAADNRIYRKIEEELGIRFDIRFLTGELDETLVGILSEDTYPDLIDGANSAQILEDAGVLIDLLPYISEDKTPNLYKHLYTDNRIRQLLKEDGKLCVSSRKKAYLQIDEDAEMVYGLIEEYGGILPFDDKASPRTIQQEARLSKNAFKRAVGQQKKNGKIELKEGRIYARGAK